MKKISGVGKGHIVKNFFKRFNDPYDLRIRNAVDGEEMLHLAFSKKSFFIFLSAFLVVSFLITSLLFLFTPIKYYIPGFETHDSRKKIVALRSKIDSLEKFQKGYGLLLNNVLAVSQDDESILLDTIGLSQGQLNRAEMANQNEIASNEGVPRIVGKKPKPADTTSKKSNKPLVSKEQIEVVLEEPVKKAKVKKKRDTVIIYK